MYLRRLTNPGAWWRLLTFQTDNRLIWKMVKHWARKALPRPARPAGCGASLAEDDNANPLFPPA
ncbi:MAG: hypothetical protein R2708_02475 [Vicinamibacterales bacterium]